MKNALKEVFSLKTILSCYIGAVGYGIGYNLPNKWGWHPILCLVCCLVLGSVFDALAKKITTTDYFQKALKNRWIVAVVVYAAYLIAWLIVDKFLQYDLDTDFLFSLGFIVIIQIVLLVKNAVQTLTEGKNSNKAAAEKEQ